MEKKLKYISLFLFIILFSLTNVLADLSVKYTIYEGEIDSSGNLIKKSNTLSGFNVNVYPCNNDACTSIGSLIPSLSTSSLSDNVIISYPHEMLTTYGYALYFYNEDYIGFQLWNEKAWGTSTTIYEGQKIYLSKRVGGHIPISGFEFNSQTPKNQNTNFNVKINLSSSDYILIFDKTHFDTGLIEKVKVNVTFNVLNGSSILSKQEKTIELPYGESLTNIPFNYTFTEVGLYNVSVETEIIDSKFKSTSIKDEIKEIKVVSDSKYNYSSSYIVNVDYSSLNQYINDKISVNFIPRSNYIDEFGNTYNKNNSVNVTIKNQTNLIYSNISNVNYNNLFSFFYNFDKEGIYNVSFEICPIEDISSDKTCTSLNLTYNITKKDSSRSVSKGSSSTNKQESIILYSSEELIQDSSEMTTDNQFSSETISLNNQEQGEVDSQEVLFFTLISVFGFGSIGILTLIIVKFLLFI